jgi:hypothetical protein
LRADGVTFAQGFGAHATEKMPGLLRQDYHGPRSAVSGWRVVEFEEEEIWLRHRVGRLRTALRIAKEPRVEAILRELIIDAEKRLELIEEANAKKPPAATN